MATRTQIIEKVVSLQALAKDQKDKPEGKLADKMAKQIIAKYKITKDELKQHKANMDNQPGGQTQNASYRSSWEWSDESFKKTADILFTAALFAFGIYTSVKNKNKDEQDEEE